MHASLARQVWQCRAVRARCWYLRYPKAIQYNSFHKSQIRQWRQATPSPSESPSGRGIRKIFIDILKPAGACAVVILIAAGVYYSDVNDYIQPLPTLMKQDSIGDKHLSPSAQKLTVDGGAITIPNIDVVYDIESKEYVDRKSGWDEAKIQNEDDGSNSSGDAPSGGPLSLDRIASIGTSVKSIEWSSIPNKVADLVVPDWVRIVPHYITKLQEEFSTEPGTLADEVWQDALDPIINPEIAWNASVRISNDLCDEEKAFLRRRKERTRIALARYLDLPEYDVNVDDVPTIAMCGSGGGLRALVAGTGSYLAAHKVGLFDCVTYTAGVSGSCWLQALYYSSLGSCRHDKLVDHLKARLGVHIAFPPDALALVTAAPTNKFLLSGLIERLHAEPQISVGLVDIYGLLLASRLLVPKGELGVCEADLKLSKQRAYVDNGNQPLPIYTAVRHEIPLVEAAKEKAEGGSVEDVKEKAKEEAWFQWFEFTPHELWCEELQAGIPTWAIGRKFVSGKDVREAHGLPLPELKMPFMLGLWGSAFCATLSHYYREIKPIVKGIVGFGSVDRLIEGRNDDLIKVHPIDPAAIPNYALGLEEQLPKTCPESIFRSSHLQLMDAGMSNNLPIYPLLRPGRNVDILIAFDASADVRSDNWLSVADGYARQRGIKGWPVGVGWPKSSEVNGAEVPKLEAAQVATAQDTGANVQVAKTEQDEQRKPEAITQEAEDLSYCTVWVGTTEERTSTDEPPPSKKVTADTELTVPNAGITLIYFPFIPNDKVEGLDPQTSDFLSTWNFIYTPEQVDKVVALSRANFDEGKEQTKAAVRAVYERKKKLREEKEWEEKMARRRRKIRLGIVGKLGEGDHFS